MTNEHEHMLTLHILEQWNQYKKNAEKKMKEEENQDKNDSLYEPENTYGMTVDQADTARRRGAKLKAILNLSGETAVIGYDDDSVYIHAHGQSEPTYMSYTEAEALAKMLLSAAEELRLDIGGN